MRAMTLRGLITDSGYTQDFLVTSALVEPIITYLTEPVEKEDLFRQVLDFRGFYDIYHGRSLEGFIKRILRRDESLEVGELLPYIQDGVICTTPRNVPIQILVAS